MQLLVSLVLEGGVQLDERVCRLGVCKTESAVGVFGHSIVQGRGVWARPRGRIKPMVRR